MILESKLTSNAIHPAHQVAACLLKQDIVISLICAVWIIIIPDFTQAIHFKKKKAHILIHCYISVETMRD